VSDVHISPAAPPLPVAAAPAHPQGHPRSEQPSSVPTPSTQPTRPTTRLVAAQSTVRVVPWPDPVIDRLGYDPRSLYVETFWLGILGPTSTWLLRRIAIGFDDHPSGFELDAGETARQLGLGDRVSRNSPIRRAMARCVKFETARHEGPDTLGVRRRLPPLPRRYLIQLPTSLQEEHRRWIAPVRRSPVLDDARRQARHLALGLLASGEDRANFEAQLVRWGVHPALAAEATQWAHSLARAGDAPTAVVPSSSS
jgi:hypothetical protein